MATLASAKRKAKKKNKMSTAEVYAGPIAMIVLGVAGMLLAKTVASLGLGLVVGAVVFYVSFGLIRQKSHIGFAGSFVTALVLVAVVTAGVAVGLGPILK